MTSEVITSREWSEINDIIAMIYSAKPMPNLLDIIDHLRELVPFTHSLACLIGTKGTKVEFFKYQSSDISPEHLQLYRDHYIYHDFILWYCAAPQELTFRESDIIAEPYMSDSIFMKEWLTPMNVRYAAGINIAGRGLSYGNICIYRPESSGDFSDKDLLLLKTINEHLCICFRNLFPNGLRSNHLTERQHDLSQRYQLTARETELLRLVGAGTRRSDLAAELYISENTVKKHLNNIFHKMDIASFEELVAKAHTGRHVVTREEMRSGLESGS